jgi:fumarylpyruvate hydrolase
VLPQRDRGHPSSGRVWLAVDGQAKQDSNVAELTWPVPDIVATVSRSMELRPGDLTMTGGIDGLEEIKISTH